MIALRIYRNNELVRVLTERTGLIIENGEVKNDLSAFEDCEFRLFDIEKQVPVKYKQTEKTKGEKGNEKV